MKTKIEPKFNGSVVITTMYSYLTDRLTDISKYKSRNRHRLNFLNDKIIILQVFFYKIGFRRIKPHSLIGAFLESTLNSLVYYYKHFKYHIFKLFNDVFI